MDFFTELTVVREVTLFAVLLRIVVAAFLGGFMGLERGLKNRAAGLRTYMLVCVGACLIMLTNQFIYQSYAIGDPVRMGAQVISGIGFLGAGTIIVTRRSQVKGLTTAAGLWTAAGVGLALGIGFYEGAIVGFFTVLAVMTLMQYMDNKMRNSTRTFHFYVELDGKITLGDLLRQLREMGFDVRDVQKQTGTDIEGNIRAYTATMEMKKRAPHQIALEKVISIEGVIYAETL